METQLNTQCGHSPSPGSQRGAEVGGSPREAPFPNSHKASLDQHQCGTQTPRLQDLHSPLASPLLVQPWVHLSRQGWEPSLLHVSSGSPVHAGNPLPDPDCWLSTLPDFPLGQ